MHYPKRRCDNGGSGNIMAEMMDLNAAKKELEHRFESSQAQLAQSQAKIAQQEQLITDLQSQMAKLEEQKKALTSIVDDLYSHVPRRSRRGHPPALNRAADVTGL